MLNGGLHELNIPKDKLNEYINSHSYFDYLKNTLGVDDEGVLTMARNSGLDWALTGTDLMTIATAKNVGAMGFIPKKSISLANMELEELIKMIIPIKKYFIFYKNSY